MAGATSNDRPEQDERPVNGPPRAYFVGGGIGSLAAAAFMIRDGHIPGGNLWSLEAGATMGGKLKAAYQVRDPWGIEDAVAKARAGLTGGRDGRGRAGPCR